MKSTTIEPSSPICPSPSKQADGALALHTLLHFLGDLMPRVVSWEIGPAGEIRGRLAEHPEGPVRAVRAAHRMLGGTVASYKDGGRDHLKAIARHRGHQITLWTPTMR